MMERYYKVGELCLSIAGESDNNYFNALCSYFAEKEISTIGGEVLLRISIESIDKQNAFPSAALYSLSGAISFNQDVFHIKKDKFSYTVNNLFDDTKITDVTFYPRESLNNTIKRIGAAVLRPSVGGHDKYSYFISVVTNYSCLWYIFALTLMKKSLFVHSRMMSKAEKALKNAQCYEISIPIKVNPAQTAKEILMGCKTDKRG